MDDAFSAIGLFIKFFLVAAAVFALITLADFISRKLWGFSFAGDIWFLSVLVPLALLRRMSGPASKSKAP